MLNVARGLDNLLWDAESKRWVVLTNFLVRGSVLTDIVIRRLQVLGQIHCLVRMGPAHSEAIAATKLIPSDLMLQSHIKTRKVTGFVQL